MSARTRIGWRLICALVAVAAGATGVAAGVARTPAGAESGAPGDAGATVKAGDAGVPLPFLGEDGSAARAGFETHARTVRGPREGERADARMCGRAAAGARGTTRARAASLAYLEYALALFMWRAGIPTNHTTAPPPRDS
jgi:hypothetical protein